MVVTFLLFNSYKYPEATILDITDTEYGHHQGKWFGAALPVSEKEGKHADPQPENSHKRYPGKKRWPSREVRKGHRIQNKSKDTGFFRNQEKIYKRYCPESNAAVKSITIRTAKNTWFRIKKITGDLIKNYLVGLVKVEAEFCGGKEQMEGKKLRKQVFLDRKGKTRTKSEARDREAAEKECGSKGIQTRFCMYKW